MDDGFGHVICNYLNLGNGHPIMCKLTEPAYLFEADGKFYLWYCVGLDILQITYPKMLDDIIAALMERGDGAVRAKTLL